MAVIRVYVAPGHWLAPGPAAALSAALTAGMPPQITDAGRTRAEQAKLYADDPGIAAHPDSPLAFHIVGEAVDLGSDATAWLVAHPAYGFRRTLNPPEWWHHQWFAALATYQEDDMFTENDRYAQGLILAAMARTEVRSAQALAILNADDSADVDEAEVARLVLAGLTPEKIAAAIPPAFTELVADQLAARLTNGA